jgi:hypothetical protein
MNSVIRFGILKITPDNSVNVFFMACAWQVKKHCTLEKEKTKD